MTRDVMMATNARRLRATLHQDASRSLLPPDHLADKTAERNVTAKDIVLRPSFANRVRRSHVTRDLSKH
jgi:hypothetical protein